MNGDGGGLSFLDALTVFSVILQMQNYQNELRSISNGDLMAELQKQDKAYLEKIIEKQNKILELLEARSPIG